MSYNLHPFNVSRHFQVAPRPSEIAARRGRITSGLTLAIMAIGLATAYPRQLIISGSMMPTIPVGTIIVADRLSYTYSRPTRGDIVVFKPMPDFSDSQWSHRIVAVPGDVVTTKDGILRVNGQPTEFPATTDPDSVALTVPLGFYYEKGDNVDALNGLVPSDAVIAKIVWY